MDNAEYQRQWRANNRDKVREQNKRRAEKKRLWALANPEVGKRATARWSKNNKNKRNAITARRYTRKCSQTPPLTDLERAEIAGIYAKAKALTEMIGVQYHVDHIIPLIKGGIHHPSNLQVLRGADNQRKGTK